MPQLKIHKSAKARRQANREKSNKHYQLNKEVINSRRRAQYQEKKDQPLRNPTTGDESEGVDTRRDLPPKSERNPVDVWLERASRIHSRFLKYLDGSDIQFLHKTCREYLKEGNGNSIIDRGNLLQDYRGSILRCHENVLQLAGAGKELEKINSMIQDVKKIIDWLDGVEMAALEGVDEVRQTYHRGGFDFQKRA